MHVAVGHAWFFFSMQTAAKWEKESDDGNAMNDWPYLEEM